MSAMQSPSAMAATHAVYGLREIAAVAIAVVPEVLLAALATNASTEKFALVALHGIVVAVVAAVLFWHRAGDRDATTAMVLLLAIAIAGPAGVAGALAMLLFAHRGEEGPRVIAAWYDRLA